MEQNLLSLAAFLRAADLPASSRSLEILEGLNIHPIGTIGRSKAYSAEQLETLRQAMKSGKATKALFAKAKAAKVAAPSSIAERIVS